MIKIPPKNASTKNDAARRAFIGASGHTETDAVAILARLREMGFDIRAADTRHTEGYQPTGSGSDPAYPPQGGSTASKPVPWRDAHTITDWEFAEIGKLLCDYRSRDLALMVVRLQGEIETYKEMLNTRSET